MAVGSKGKAITEKQREALKKGYAPLKGKHHSIETRQQMSAAHKARRPEGWQPKNPINKVIRGSLQYKLWREAVFRRDNYTCIWCGARSGNGEHVELHSDHIKPFALFPELRFAIDNGRTLCVPCHKTTPTFAGRTRDNHQSNERKARNTQTRRSFNRLRKP